MWFVSIDVIATDHRTKLIITKLNLLINYRYRYHYSINVNRIKTPTLLQSFRNVASGCGVEIVSCIIGSRVVTNFLTLATNVRYNFETRIRVSTLCREFECCLCVYQTIQWNYLNRISEFDQMER